MSILYIIPRGGFGNILFNWLSGISIARDNGLEPHFVINPGTSDRRSIINYRFFKNLRYSTHKNAVIVREPHHFYTPFRLSPDRNYALDGYFQSYKYFNRRLPELKEELIKGYPQDELLRLKEEFSQFNTTVAVHVRRGDYMNLPDYHPVQSNNYFKQGLDLLVKDNTTTLLVFSDDIPFLKSWELLKNYNYQIIDRDVEECFLLMSFCDHFLISNSSLSLLAYLLRNNKDAQLVMPKNWFGPKGPSFKLEDLVEITPNVFIL